MSAASVARSPVAARYRSSAWKNQSVASAVWYSPSLLPSGNMLGMSPSRTYWPNVRRM